MNLAVTSEAADVDVTDRARLEFLERHLRRVWAMLEDAPAELSVAIVGEETMSRLHEQFLGQPGPTDVLSFELAHDAVGRVVEGEIVICHVVAAHEARRRGHPAELELLLYAIHGLLHLCGYDDLDERGFAAMHAREDELLAALGFGPVFARAQEAE